MRNELKHYGILGMKWGHRRALKRIDRAEKRLKKRQDKYDKISKDWDVDEEKMPKGIEAEFKEEKRIGDARDNFVIAKNKAKLDPSYKKSKEYKSAILEYGSVQAERVLYGKTGMMDIAKAKAEGKSVSLAKAKASLTRFSQGWVTGMLVLDLMRLTSRKIRQNRAEKERKYQEWKDGIKEFPGSYRVKPTVKEAMSNFVKKPKNLLGYR